MRSRWLMAAAFSVAALLPGAYAAGTKSSGDPAPALDALLAPLVDPALPPAKRYVGISAATLQAGQAQFFGYGESSLGGGHRPEATTVYEIGSATKVITALAAVALSRLGVISLDDPVDRYLPPTTQAPRSHGLRIRLWHLLTHTSGLPRLPPNLNTPEGDLDPYRNYGPAELLTFLGSYQLPRLPGRDYEYSNVGMGLLGYLLSQRLGLSYDAMIRELVTAPLGMNDTVITLSGDQERRYAPGYKWDGLPTVAWHFFDTLAGAGALKSTAADLVRFMRANLGRGPEDLTAALRTMRIPRHDLGSQPGAIGYAWHLTDGGVVWHNGATYGHHCFLAFDPVEGTAVVLLSNSLLLTPDEKLIDPRLETAGLKALAALAPTARSAAPGR